ERLGAGRRGEPGSDESARAGSLRESAPESPFRGLRGESRRLTAAPRAMARLSLLVPDPPAATGCSACAPATPRTPLAGVGPTTPKHFRSLPVAQRWPGQLQCRRTRPQSEQVLQSAGGPGQTHLIHNPSQAKNLRLVDLRTVDCKSLVCKDLRN